MTLLLYFWRVMAILPHLILSIFALWYLCYVEFSPIFAHQTGFASNRLQRVCFACRLMQHAQSADVPCSTANADAAASGHRTKTARCGGAAAPYTRTNPSTCACDAALW